MKNRIGLAVAACLIGSWVAAMPGPDPRERNFKFFVDGVEIDGVVGYRINFARMAITGEPDGGPTKIGVAVSDLISGCYLAVGIAAALAHALRTFSLYRLRS